MSSLRSNKLFGQIKRTLRLKKYAEDDFQPTEIYDSLRSAQEQIFARINFERKYSIAILPNVSEYLLSTDNSMPVADPIPLRGNNADMATKALELAGTNAPVYFFNTEQNCPFFWNGIAFV